MTDAVKNPLLAPLSLPYDLPPYGSIVVEHYLPAFHAGFAAQRAEVDAISAQSEEPTFENTLVALERSGELLDRVARAFYTVASADGTPGIQAVEEQLAPLMAAHGDAIQLDAALFARVAAVHAQLDDLGLDAESRYLVERHHREMSLAGGRSRRRAEAASDRP